MDAKISIIIPCYNYGHLISYAIDSIRNQTYENWELLVVDDGSTDNTSKVVKGYESADTRIRYHLIKNSGPSVARNVGLSVLTGDFFMFLDADDLIPDTKLAAHMAHFQQFPELDVSYSDGLYFDHRYPEVFYRRGSLRNIPWIPVLENQAGYPVIKELMRSNIMPICSPIFRAKVMNDVGLLDESYYYMEDWDYFVRCALSGHKFGYLPGMENAVLIRVQEVSLSKNIKRMALHEAQLRKKFEDKLDCCHISTSLNLLESEIRALKQLNKLQMYRAYLRSGKWNVMRKLYSDDLGINMLNKTLIFALDALRYVKHFLSDK